MMIFRNPGLIDMSAVRTMGVNVKAEGSFGRFGTGLKFSLAVILRNGGAITIYRGEQQHDVASKPVEIRGEPFDLVTIDGDEIGIATTLGRDWEPWMVLRELACNAMDEGGTFYRDDDDNGSMGHDETVITVDWPALDEAYDDRGNLFLDRSEEPFISDQGKFEAWKRPSQFVYYRGIRAYKLHKQSMLTYNITAEQTLTEDRTLIGTYSLDQMIKEYMVKKADMEQVEAAITAPGEFHESEINYPEYETPSRAFVDTAIGLKEKRKSFNGSARKLMLKALRQDESFGGGSIAYTQITSAPLEAAAKIFDQCGLDFDLSDTPVVSIDELPADQMSIAEGGRIYILSSLLKKPVPEICYELLRRWVEIKCPGDTVAEAVQILATPLFRQSNAWQFASEFTEQSADENAKETEDAT